MTASLLDTNVLVYANNADSPFHSACKAIIDRALNGEIQAVVAIQNLVELYAVITDGRRVEHPLSPEQGRNLLDFYAASEHLRTIHPGAGTLSILSALIREHEPKAQNIFDFMLVATMMENAVSDIYTFNVDHFKPFKTIIATRPQ